MADARRLVALGTPTQQAKELAKQMDGSGTAAVESVNGQTGTVVLTADDVGALPDDYTPPAVAWDDVTDKPTTFPAATRTIALTGGATGTSAAFTGAANASIPVTLATPTASVRGGVLQGAAQADSVAADAAELVTDFNALLAKLRTAGVIAT